MLAQGGLWADSGLCLTCCARRSAMPAELTAGCKGRDVPVPTSLPREPTLLVFSLGADLSRSSCGRRMRHRPRWLGGQGWPALRGCAYEAAAGRGQESILASFACKSGCGGSPEGQPRPVTLGVYREERREVETGWMEQEEVEGGGEERRHEPHTWGSPKWPCRQGRVMPYQWARGIQSVQPW